MPWQNNGDAPEDFAGHPPDLVGWQGRQQADRTGRCRPARSDLAEMHQRPTFAVPARPWSAVGALRVASVVKERPSASVVAPTQLAVGPAPLRGPIGYQKPNSSLGSLPTALPIVQRAVPQRLRAILRTSRPVASERTSALSRATGARRLRALKSPDRGRRRLGIDPDRHARHRWTCTTGAGRCSVDPFAVGCDGGWARANSAQGGP